MARVVPRTILVCAFPAVLSLLTFLWIRKKKKNAGSLEFNTTGNLTTENIAKDSRTCIDSSSKTQTQGQTVAEMHLMDQNQSTSDLMIKLDGENTVDGLGEGGYQSSDVENEVSCSDDKSTMKDSVSSDVTEHLAQLTIGESVTSDEGSMEDEVDSPSREPIVLKEKHRNCSRELGDQDSSRSGIPAENAEAEIAPKVTKCDSLAAENAPDIVIESSFEESQTNDEFVMSDLKLFDTANSDDQEIQTSVTIGSFDSVNYSEMDDLTDSPPHSTYSDVQSEGSSDSGKGGSDIQAGSDLSQATTGEDAVVIYEFELPQDLCGRLIGRLGRHVNFIKSRSGANVFIKKHLFNPRVKICAVEGNKSEIKNALELIRKRFPFSQFPNVNLNQINVPIPCGVMVPETLQLHLPEGVTSDVILSSMVSAGHFFVQQPTHPTYPSLNRLDQCMLVCYSQMETPELPQPVEVGVICSAPMMGGWYRASVVHVYENSEECDVKFVDYGGYSGTSVSSLRQIRSDFMTLPFQASECYLANVKPPDDDAGWSLEACATFEELAQGQILQSLIVAHAEDGIPYVHLYRIQGVSTVFINRELVNRGVAQWVEHQL